MFECVKYPVVAVGVVRWVEHTMLDPMFFEEAAESSSLFLVLLDEVIIVLTFIVIQICIQSSIRGGPRSVYQLEFTTVNTVI